MKLMTHFRLSLLPRLTLLENVPAWFSAQRLLSMLIIAVPTLSYAQSVTTSVSPSAPAPTIRDAGLIAMLKKVALSLGGPSALLAIKDVSLDLQVTGLLTNPPVNTGVHYPPLGRTAYKTETIGNSTLQA